MKSLAEAAALHLRQEHEDGPLDDDIHWIWNCALAVDEDIVKTNNEANNNVKTI